MLDVVVISFRRARASGLVETLSLNGLFVTNPHGVSGDWFFRVSDNTISSHSSTFV